MSTVLCLCSGNTCRSPMLSTLLRAALANAKRTAPGAEVQVQVLSAGTGAIAGMPASEGAQRAMTRRGLSLSHHHSTPLAEIDPARIDRVYAMGPHHAAAAHAYGIPSERITVINEVVGGVPDPWGGDDATYEICAEVLELAARDIVLELP